MEGRTAWGPRGGQSLPCRQWRTPVGTVQGWMFGAPVDNMGSYGLRSLVCTRAARNQWSWNTRLGQKDVQRTSES